ncbi:CD209 antigen-like protein C isoform X2 [Centroberyx affinis]|uniref:CD209 antigen-like protein C isoform X2 n=1 Tax=Centroberyx affinis TaxID=166261 RepID=UPI003A5C5D4A
MSVAFNSNSGEPGGEYLNLVDVDDDFRIRSENGGGFQSSVCVQWGKRWTGAAAVCLGLLCLLLLALIIGLAVHNTTAAGHHDVEMQDMQTKCGNLTNQWSQLQSSYNSLTGERDQLQSRYNSLTGERDQLQSSYNSLTAERDALRNERNQLKSNSSSLAKEKAELQSQCDTVAASRDELQEEVNRLALNMTEKPCRLRWIKFNISCYYISTESKSWDKSRQDCRDRGADLAIINNKEEQNFLSRFHDRLWIGLSDKHAEGKWQWVDGTSLVGGGFWQDGEPNDDSGREDCVEVSRGGGGWNDLPCRERLSWACEE